MITYKEARQILETMTAEPENGQEARLSADELDAVLYAIKVIKGEEIPRGEWEYIPPYNYGRRFGKWLFMNGGLFKCSNCKKDALKQYSFCPNCGARMTEEYDNIFKESGCWVEVPVKRDVLYVNGIKYVCSVCKKSNSYGKSPFCMYCGAQMRKGGDL